MTDSFLAMIASETGKGGNYFHEACRSAALLQNIKPYVQVEHRHLLRAHNHDGLQPIHVAAMMETGKPAAKIIELLIEMGADINGTERDNHYTALHIATSKKDYDLVEWLCKQNDVSINALSSMKKTPYEIARIKGDRKMMKMLENLGAATNSTVCSEDYDKYMKKVLVVGILILYCVFQIATDFRY